MELSDGAGGSVWVRIQWDVVRTGTEEEMGHHEEAGKKAVSIQEKS